MKKIWTTFCLLTLLSIPCTHAWADVDGISVNYGFTGDPRIDNYYRLGLRWDWGVRWLAAGNWYMNGYFEPNIFYIDSKGKKGGGETGLYGVSFSPVFRYTADYGWGSPYIEGSIGVAYLSESRIGGENLGSNYQFDDRLGAGVRFGEKRQYEFGYQFVHYSNAGIKSPNDGIDADITFIFAYYFS